MDKPMGIHTPTSVRVAKAGVVAAEAGHVIVEGLPGLAATLTPEDAIRLAEHLVLAAEEARRHR